MKLTAMIHVPAYMSTWKRAIYWIILNRVIKYIGYDDKLIEIVIAGFVMMMMKLWFLDRDFTDSEAKSPYTSESVTEQSETQLMVRMFVFILIK